MKTLIFIAISILTLQSAHAQDQYTNQVLIQGQIDHQRIMTQLDQYQSQIMQEGREQMRVSNAINWNNNQARAIASGVAPIAPAVNPYAPILIVPSQQIYYPTN